MNFKRKGVVSGNRLSKIIHNFSKAITDLDALAGDCAKESAIIGDNIDKLKAEQQDLNAVEAQAKGISANISRLLDA